MKKEWVWFIALSLGIIFIIPWSVVRWHKEKELTNYVEIRVMMPNGEIEILPLEEYLLGVVAAEMPAEFELEALKAQAIAARTYAAKRINQSELTDAKYDVDTTVQNQVWLSDAQMKNYWGWFNYWRYRNKFQKAMHDTYGLVLVAKGEYIDALYHSSSGRKATERSEEVWNSSREYLKNVNSGEENQQRYVKTITLSPQELFKKLGNKETPRALATRDFQVIDRTAAGRAKSVRVLGKVYQTTQLRTLLGLPSTDLEWIVQPDRLSVTTYGNGHAVGMSQWGANDLAKKSKTFEEILAHFYPGTKLMKLGRI